MSGTCQIDSRIDTMQNIEYMSDGMSEYICPIEFLKYDCQIECQNICPIEC